jgi:hypothetical protein
VFASAAVSGSQTSNPLVRAAGNPGRYAAHNQQAHYAILSYEVVGAPGSRSELMFLTGRNSFGPVGGPLEIYFGPGDPVSLQPGDTGLFPDAIITAAGILGDVNGDATVHFADLTPFVKALTDVAAYEAMFPGLNRVARCDISGDGICSFDDIPPFVALLAGVPVGPTVVPEPSITMLSCFLALPVVLRRRRASVWT